MTKHNKTFFVFISLLFFFQAVPVFAALDLSVLSVEGTNSLRLGRVLPGLDNKKQLRIRIRSTDGVQYQVFQRVIEPIVNEKGEAMNLQAMETATMPNSNASGTLYLQNVERLSFGEQLLYTSGQGGPSDEFQIAYSLRPDLLNVSGNLMGKLCFTLRPIGAGSPQQVFVNVMLESSADWKASVEGGRTPERIRIKDTDTTAALADFVKIDYSGNTAQEVRIYQFVDELPRNEMGNELGADVLKFGVDGGAADVERADGIMSLARGRVLIYSGNKMDDKFSVYFMTDPDKASSSDAGVYTGKLKYVVEHGTTTEPFTLDVEFQVQPFFVMDVDLPPDGVKFTNILPDAPPVEREATIRVRSNIHKAYQISQDLPSLMVNNKGEEIAKEYLTFKIEIPEGQGGHTRFADFTPLATGEYPVFASDVLGAPVELKVMFRLKGYTQMPGGEFTAPIRYSLNQN